MRQRTSQANFSETAMGAATPGRRSNLCGGVLVVESRMVPFVGGQNRNDAWRRS
jgi:hypothetical protein